MLKIRRYEERDFEAYVGTLEKTTNWGKEAEQELAARIRKMTEKEEIWVAEAGVKAVGFMLLTPNDDVRWRLIGLMCIQSFSVRQWPQV